MKTFDGNQCFDQQNTNQCSWKGHYGTQCPDTGAHADESNPSWPTFAVWAKRDPVLSPRVFCDVIHKSEYGPDHI